MVLFFLALDFSINESHCCIWGPTEVMVSLVQVFALQLCCVVGLIWIAEIVPVLGWRGDPLDMAAAVFQELQERI